LPDVNRGDASAPDDHVVTGGLISSTTLTS